MPLENGTNWLQYNGSTLGTDYAEAYNLVYCIK